MTSDTSLPAQNALTTPTRVELTKEEAAALQDLTSREAALNDFMQQMMVRGEQRIAQLRQDSQKLYHQIGSKYGLDFSKGVYAPSRDGAAIVLQQIRVGE